MNTATAEKTFNTQAESISQKLKVKDTYRAVNTQVDSISLELKVKDMYRDVALNPEGDYHFEMGRIMAERLGYIPEELDQIPASSIASFAGVGCYFNLADIKQGESVIDLGSGSGLDAFNAAIHVGGSGKVVGVDMTDEQLEKSRRLQKETNFNNIDFVKSYIQETPYEDGSFDVVISNGVVNLATDKTKVFKEAARLLKPGGRLALSDIVSEVPLPENITCDSTLWAACIGGALEENNYLNAIMAAGLIVEVVVDNPEYHFISEGAAWATENYGVKSISVLAKKPDGAFSMLYPQSLTHLNAKLN
ncbi:MAG: methyltransferase domain-containing protein [Cocleimonas sp.]